MIFTSNTDQASADFAVPDGGILLHVGVHKTGTTSLQLHVLHHQAEMLERGVLCRGPQSWGATGLPRLESVSPDIWAKLLRDVNGHEGRVFLSSEDLCSTDLARSREMAKALAGDRPVRVLVTARSLASLLPTTWQQAIKDGRSTKAYEEWLEGVFAPDSDSVYWRRYDFPEQIRKWTKVAGDGNVMLCMTSKDDPERVLRLVARLFDASDLFEGEEMSNRNQSVTFQEAELIRRVNLRVKGTVPQSTKRMKMGMIRGLHKSGPRPGDKIPVPRWAAEKAAQAGSDQAKVLAEMPARNGLVILGDPAALGELKWDVEGKVEAPTAIDLDVASLAVAQTMIGDDHPRFRKRTAAAATPAPEPDTKKGRRLFGRSGKA